MVFVALTHRHWSCHWMLREASDPVGCAFWIIRLLALLGGRYPACMEGGSSWRSQGELGCVWHSHLDPPVLIGGRARESRSLGIPF